jgi:hypothetical protein
MIAARVETLPEAIVDPVGELGNGVRIGESGFHARERELAPAQIGVLDDFGMVGADPLRRVAVHVERGAQQRQQHRRHRERRRAGRNDRLDAGLHGGTIADDCVRSKSPRIS